METAEGGEEKLVTRLYTVHLAAAEARVLAVSFLLGVSADPCSKDRWEGTPLDDALRGGTLYHYYCGKLIQGPSLLSSVADPPPLFCR